MTKKRKSFEERYKNTISEKSMAKIKKMAQKGKGWGWRRSFLGKLEKKDDRA
jgi:DNA invertase Pin-like site-specific DNA recombinase